MPEYDHPFYKQLRKNDIGIDTHQGGPAIPKALLPYFPPLPAPGTSPTEEYWLTLDLFDGANPVATTSSRWHYQTWGRSRTPEHRLTHGIQAPLLDNANIDDLLVFERQADTTDRFRITLVRAGTAQHREILLGGGGSRWGPIEEEPLPLHSMFERETVDILQAARAPFSLIETRTFEASRRLVRDAAFARVVKRAYAHSCAACGSGYVVPVGEPGPDPQSEPEAAHIVPVALHGPDDPRNGLCLCRAHHWAFDRNLIFVGEDSTWRATVASKKENRNVSLNDIDGIPLTPPENGYPKPAGEALAWHRARALSA